MKDQNSESIHQGKNTILRHLFCLSTNVDKVSTFTFLKLSMNLSKSLGDDIGLVREKMQKKRIDMRINAWSFSQI